MKKTRIIFKYIFPVLIMGLFATLSVPKSFTGDEALTVTLCSNSFSTMIKNVALESHVPGYHILLWIWIKLFGNSLFVLRLFAFLPVGLLIYIGSRHFNRYSFLVFAFSPFLLQLSVELRMYGILALIGMSILVYLQKLTESFSVKTFSYLLFLSVAAVWIHYFSWCVVAAASVLLFLNKRKKYAVLLVAVSILAIIPWLPNLVQQIHRFGPGGESASVDLFQLATPVQRLIGVPFSITGTLLRFASGNAVFQFNLFSIRNMSLWTIAGILLFAAAAFSAWKGRKTAGPGVFILLLLTFIPLSFLRPTARHFAVAYPAFAALVIAGLEGNSRLKQILRVLIPALSILLCIPFMLRTTMPQRCTFNRDFKEAAIMAGTAASKDSVELVVFLDTHSLMGILYHLEDEGFTDLTVTHPHEEIFASGWYFHTKPMEILSFLMQDTDSLVQEWGDNFYLLANDPTESRGPLFGEENLIVGRGSDIVADLDLIICLNRYYTVERIPLPNSEGSFTLFHATSLND